MKKNTNITRDEIVQTLLDAVMHVLITSEDGGCMSDISFEFLRDCVKKSTTPEQYKKLMSNQ